MFNETIKKRKLVMLSKHGKCTQNDLPFFTAQDRIWAIQTTVNVQGAVKHLFGFIARKL